MIECLYRWCPHHAQAEPFCGASFEPGEEVACKATPVERGCFKRMRQIELVLDKVLSWDGAPHKNGHFLARQLTVVSDRVAKAVANELNGGSDDG